MLMIPGTRKFRNDEITTNGLLPFEATPLETVPLKPRTVRNVIEGNVCELHCQ